MTRPVPHRYTDPKRPLVAALALFSTLALAGDDS